MIRRRVIFAFLGCATGAPLCAERINWTDGAGDGEWASAANWDLGRIPAAGDDVVIADPSGTLTITYRRDAATINSLVCDANFFFTTTGNAPARLAVTNSAAFNADLTVNGGTLTGDGSISVGGLFHWTGGAITSDSPQSPIISKGTLVISSSLQKTLGRRLVLAPGTSASWSGLGVLTVSRQSVVEISSGATFDLLNDVSILESAGAGTATIQNAGTLRKRAGPGVSTLSVHLENAGRFEIDRGVASIVHGYRQIAGELFQNGGRIRASTLLSLEGGSLRGSGVVEAGISNTGATIRPGVDVGELTIAGAYAQSGSAQIEIEFQTQQESTAHDFLTFADVAVLDGEVALRFLSDPPLSGSFVVIEAAPLLGDARQVSTFCLDPIAEAQIQFSETQATVTFAAEMCASDLNGDGLVTLQDLAQLLAGFGLTDASRAQGDLNGDCAVSLADLVLLLSAFGSGCP